MFCKYSLKDAEGLFQDQWTRLSLGLSDDVISLNVGKKFSQFGALVIIDFLWLLFLKYRSTPGYELYWRLELFISFNYIDVVLILRLERKIIVGTVVVNVFITGNIFILLSQPP